MLNTYINTLKAKLNPLALLTTAKNAIITLYQTIVQAGPMILVGFIVSYFFAWWGMALVTFFYAAFKKDLNVKSAFGLCLTAGITLWSVYSIFLNTANDGFLAAKMGSLLTGGISSISPSQLIQGTALIGGLLSAMGGVTGVLAREFVYDTRLKFGWKW
jgi:hypothetical protein